MFAPECFFQFQVDFEKQGTESLLKVCGVEICHHKLSLSGYMMKGFFLVGNFRILDDVADFAIILFLRLFMWPN